MGKFDGILLLTDLDGTLAYDGVVSYENRKAVEYFKQNGGMFTYATGRMPAYIKKIGIEANVPVVATNGTIIYDFNSKEILKNLDMPNEVINVAKKLANSSDINIISVCTSEKRYNFEKPSLTDFDTFKGRINKLVFAFVDEESTLKAKKFLMDRYRDFVFERSWNSGLEMRSRTSGKGVCLKALKEMTGARLAIAAGDYENDVDMLKAADISYAPADALEVVKSVAGRIGVEFKDHLLEYIISDIEKDL